MLLSFCSISHTLCFLGLSVSGFKELKHWTRDVARAGVSAFQQKRGEATSVWHGNTLNHLFQPVQVCESLVYLFQAVDDSSLLVKGKNHAPICYSPLTATWIAWANEFTLV
jgi:hypothetical protein